MQSEKLKAIAQRGIRLLVEEQMRGRGYAYFLDENDASTILLIQGTLELVISINPTHKGFPKRIPKLLPTTAMVWELLEAMDATLLLESKPDHLEWGEVNSEPLT